MFLHVVVEIEGGRFGLGVEDGDEYGHSGGYGCGSMLV